MDIPSEAVLRTLGRRELQALSKAHALKANASSDALVAALVQRAAAAAAAAAEADEGEEEEELEASPFESVPPPEAPAAEDDDVAAITRRLESAFQQTLDSSPVGGLVARRRGGQVSDSPLPFAASRPTLTPAAGGAPGSAGSGGWLSRARDSLTALVTDWASHQASSPRPSLRATLTAVISGAPAAAPVPVAVVPGPRPQLAPKPGGGRSPLGPKPSGVAKKPLVSHGPPRAGRVAPVNPASLPYRPKTGPVPKAAGAAAPKRFDIKASLQRKPTWALKTGSVKPGPPSAPVAKPAAQTRPGIARPAVWRASVAPGLPAKQAAAAAASAAARQRTLAAARGRP